MILEYEIMKYDGDLRRPNFMYLSPTIYAGSTPLTRWTTPSPTTFFLPWNLKNEIVQQMLHVGTWGAKYIVPIPEISVIDPRVCSS